MKFYPKYSCSECNILKINTISVGAATDLYELLQNCTCCYRIVQASIDTLRPAPTFRTSRQRLVLTSLVLLRTTHCLHTGYDCSLCCLSVSSPLCFHGQHCMTREGANPEYPPHILPTSSGAQLVALRLLSCLLEKMFVDWIFLQPEAVRSCRV